MANRGKKPATDPQKVVGYLRVSTDEQTLGPDAQRAALEHWCAARDATLVAVCVDQGVSGGAALDKRPGLLAALAALKEHGAGVLLVAKWLPERTVHVAADRKSERFRAMRTGKAARRVAISRT